MRKLDVKLTPLAETESQGFVVLEATPKGCPHDSRWMLPYVQLAVSVTGEESRARECAAWITVFLVMVDAEAVRGADIPYGNTADFPLLFGKSDTVDFVNPWLRASPGVVALCERAVVGTAGQPLRVCCAPGDGRTLKMSAGTYRWIACVVYSLEGCRGASLRVQAGVLGVGRDAEERCGSASIVSPRVASGRRWWSVDVAWRRRLLEWRSRGW